MKQNERGARVKLSEKYRCCQNCAHNNDDTYYSIKEPCESCGLSKILGGANKFEIDPQLIKEITEIINEKEKSNENEENIFINGHVCVENNQMSINDFNNKFIAWIKENDWLFFGNMKIV